MSTTSVPKCILQFIAVLAVSCCSFPAASTNISGIVRDSLSGESLSEVVVTTVETNQLAFTDALGQFRITDIQSGIITLRFSRIGYKAQIITCNVLHASQTGLTIDLAKGAVRLNEIQVTGTRDLNQSLSTITRIDQVLRPTNSAQDLLRLVPGLFIAQHAGGGKAEQIFLRGFDVDHGTDFAVAIDGIPVNMVSHAHGQGYADFHFVIPETVDKLNVNKGCYSARQGDFATAGSGDFFTKRSIDRSMVRMEYGRFNTYRTVGMFRFPGRKLITDNNEHAYIAGEYNYSDSYFESSQRLNRYNLFGKYSTGIGTDHLLTASFSAFRSAWDASGQIPDRAVQSEMISLYGSLDNTEGGSTSRMNANAQLVSGIKNGAIVKNQFYYCHYTFNLYSNFTFFLHDTIHGDQIRQAENGRNIYGYAASYDKTLSIGKVTLQSVTGIGTRIDDGEIALLHSAKRITLDTISFGKIHEQNLHAYADETVVFSPTFTVQAGVRYDYFIFSYDNYISDSGEGRAGKSRVSPKLCVYYTPAPAIQLYLKSGFGFHSNDARSVVSGQAGNSLPRAFGYEAGSIFSVAQRLLVHVALWGLDLENELAYVGDEGVVEISGATRRVGIDVALRFEICPQVLADVDFNFNHGRYRHLPQGENFIPLAPALTSTGGITWKRDDGLRMALRYRFIDSRPANENNTVTAKGYFLADAVVTYEMKRFTFGLTGENLLNAKWNEAQFDTMSRLRGERAPVSELHYTPGSPFFVKASITVFI